MRLLSGLRRSLTRRRDGARTGRLDGRHHRRARGKCVVVHLVICGSDTQQCTVLFEPYGAEYVLAAEDYLRLDIDASDDSEIEVAYSTDCITLWLPASTVAVRATNRIGDTIDFGLSI